MMRCRIVVAGLLLAGPGWAEVGVDFRREVQPVLAAHCFECHGPDAASRKAGLRLDTEDGARAALTGAPSEFLRRILSTDPDVQMPPPGPARHPLSSEQVRLLERWVAEGAPWASHWAFEAVARPEAPPAGAWARNEIDAFILRRLEREGLRPAPEAPREKLLRRLSFDLTGLPPSPGEIDAFLADTSPEAYERAVGRMLASPRYGERMAMHWLDAARFADTNGFQGDFQRFMWPWRDWVIDQFNQNRRFDEFLVEQIAGDLLPDATKMQRVATGFLRNGRSVTEGGSIEEEWRVESIVERVETVGAVFLGLTTGCARCHDHKYDPFSQREFFQFYAFLNSTAEKGVYLERRGNTGPLVLFPEPEHEEKIAALEQQVEASREALRKATEEKEIPFDDWLARLAETPRGAEHDHLSLRARLHGPELSPIGPATALASAPSLGQGHRFTKDQAFSVSAWVRPDGEGALWSQMEGTPGQRGFDSIITDDLRVVAHLASAGADNGLRMLSHPSLAWGAWAHIAVTYDGSGRASGVGIYVNGKPAHWVMQYDTLKDEIATDAPLLLGRHADGAALPGAMADFRVYNTALGWDEVRGEMEQALAGAAQAPMVEAQRTALAEYYTHRNVFWTDLEQRQLEAAEYNKLAYLETEVPSVMVLEELAAPRPTYLLRRGAYDNPDTSEALQPATPAFLHPFPEGAPANRLGLAQWLVAPENPLTARVTVNRLWQGFFGGALVNTPGDFGKQSEPPSHPELLDWLASEFVESGWDVKALQKRIVMSATYRQDSAVSAELLQRDPENRLLARGPRYRMPAEFIRDNALAVSGLLTPTIGGPSIMTYQPEGLWDDLASLLKGLYKQATGPDLYRRSLYTFRKRTVPHPTLASFDAPTFEQCAVKRARTNTPLQALALMNDVTYVEAARRLAGRILREGGEAPAERLRYGFRLTTGRWPNAREEAILGDALNSYSARFQGSPEDAKAFLQHGESPVDETLDPVELASYMGFARVLLNLDETITLE
ncbi:MAG: DUF1553 domain-containing protein [Candidatus Hydrogenedentes bacterium]|nr:DUF1553 domain-containing protein [Candidatus Hydrogenedentota bacterium]